MKNVYVSIDGVLTTVTPGQTFIFKCGDTVIVDECKYQIDEVEHNMDKQTTILYLV